jgi:hypothetical protein
MLIKQMIEKMACWQNDVLKNQPVDKTANCQYGG